MNHDFVKSFRNILALSLLVAKQCFIITVTKQCFEITIARQCFVITVAIQSFVTIVFESKGTMHPYFLEGIHHTGGFC